MHTTHAHASPAVIDLFAGAGGWDEGLSQLGVGDVLGIEWNAAACATARAAGHARLQADIAALDPHAFAGTIGLIGSPPCPTFSAAGKGSGRLLTDLLVRCMLDLAAGTDTRQDILAEASAVLRCATPAVAPDRARRDAEMSLLVVEPMRWAVALQPEWIALEQVPAALPLWSVMAQALGAIGYSTWCGVLEAERYGVPQTRERAILMASRTQVVQPPQATHQRYVPGEPSRLDMTLEGEVLPWISMAEALGVAWMYDSRQARTNADGSRTPCGRRAADTPAPALTAAGLAKGRDVWQRRDSGPGAARDPRRADGAPSYTIRANGSGSHPAGVAWVEQRPATTIQGDARVWPPGHKANAEDERAGREGYGDRAGTYAVRVTVEQAAILQSFSPDYPWQGTRSQQFMQVGNAVPPLLARAVLAQLVDAPAAVAAETEEARMVR